MPPVLTEPNARGYTVPSVTDLAVLGKLFEENRPRLLAMVRRRIDPALAARLDPEEVLSAAFLEARRKCDAFKAESGLSAYAWLYGIVRDCLFEAYRKSTRGCRDHRRDLPWPDHSSVQLGLGLVGTGTSPEAAAARAELRLLMRQALDLLPKGDREILWMRHYDELKSREIAEVLGITANAAGVRYVRALQRLKELWQRLHPEQESTA
jgi:RNA polymerase sigma-70 factor (ECF subfamily)